jgi:hypothetical protein
VITGIHAVVFSPQTEKVRGFLAGTLGMTSVDDGWGLLAAIRLPDGSELPIYQPRQPSPRQP